MQSNSEHFRVISISPLVLHPTDARPPELKRTMRVKGSPRFIFFTQAMKVKNYSRKDCHSLSDPGFQW
jgi:hypothetical protein